MTLFVIGAALMFVMAMMHALMLENWCNRISEAIRAGVGSSTNGSFLKVSIVVPVRNGSGTLVPLLQDLHAQDQPRTHFEVIVVDDHSEDGTHEIVRSMQHTWPELKYVALTDTKGKKHGIMRGAMESDGTVVLITDADTRCGSRRVSTLIGHWRSTAPDLAILPVYTRSGPSALSAVQYHEQLALQAATAGSALAGRPQLANGANLAFDRKAFFELGGFRGDAWASGDDLFLLRRMQRADRKVNYLADPSVAVMVEPERTIRGFFSQRLRWAGKMRAYRDVTGTFSAIVVIVFPWLLFLMTVTVADRVRVGDGMLFTWVLLLAAWSVWLVPILRLTRAMDEVFSELRVPDGRLWPSWSRYFGTVIALAVFLIYAPVIAIVSIFVRPTWKGRRI